MARALKVSDARKSLTNVEDVSIFAKEFGISISDAEAIKAFVSDSETPEDSFVFLESVIIDGVTLAAGNVRQ